MMRAKLVPRRRAFAATPRWYSRWRLDPEATRAAPPCWVRGGTTAGGALAAAVTVERRGASGRAIPKMDLAGATIAVTGATGFLGRYITGTLLARGSRVTAVVRNARRVPELARERVELRQADLAQPERLAAGFAGADAVVSNAALFSLFNISWADHERANVIGTRNVFEAVARAGIRRVVHVSSVAIYAGSRSARLTEDLPRLNERSRRWPWNVYGVSKAIAEGLAWRLAQRHGLDLTAVRPCGMYGAFDPTFTRVYRRLVGSFLSFTPLFARLPLVYAGDVAEAIARCLERPASVGKAYNLTGDEQALRCFVKAWSEAGGPTGRLRLPLPVPFTLTAPYDNTRAKSDLGWRNRSYVTGLRETFALERGAPLA